MESSLTKRTFVTAFLERRETKSSFRRSFSLVNKAHLDRRALSKRRSREASNLGPASSSDVIFRIRAVSYNGTSRFHAWHTLDIVKRADASARLMMQNPRMEKRFLIFASNASRLHVETKNY